MIYYRVKVSIDKDVESEWLRWMRTSHIIDVLTTGLFEYAELLKSSDEYAGKSTYTVQYKLKSEENFNKYNDEFAQKLRHEHTTRYSAKFIASREINKVIETIKL